jgi:hypothetical protein
LYTSFYQNAIITFLSIPINTQLFRKRKYG